MSGHFGKSITLTLSHRSEMEHQLDSAVKCLYAPAKDLNQGILVTRLSAESFDVCVSQDVPFGVIIENVVW